MLIIKDHLYWIYQVFCLAYNLLIDHIMKLINELMDHSLSRLNHIQSEIGVEFKYIM